MIVYTVNVLTAFTKGNEEEGIKPIVARDTTLCISKDVAQKWAMRYLRTKYAQQCAHLADKDLLKRHNIEGVTIAFGKQKIITHL